jgi:hypothetical protein
LAASVVGGAELLLLLLDEVFAAIDPLLCLFASIAGLRAKAFATLFRTFANGVASLGTRLGSIEETDNGADAQTS